VVRYEIRFAGFGGQGVITAGRLLALMVIEAEPSIYVVYSPSYGFQTRGGDAVSDVIISDEEIDFPKARYLDLALILSQQAYNKYCRYVREDGALIVDKYINRQGICQSKRHHELDIVANAKALGGDVFSSMIALGSAIRFFESKSIPNDKLTLSLAEKIVADYFKESLIGRRVNVEDIIAKNIKALRLGYKMVTI